MPKTRLLLDWIALDHAGAAPLYRQLYLELRGAIESGRLPPGSLLPSSRTLARELGISRNTVLNAYNQLTVEGYADAVEGCATSVARGLSNSNEEPPGAAEALHAAIPLALSRRGRAFQECDGPVLDLPDVVAFTPGVPAFDEFPVKVWTRLLSLQTHRMSPEMADNDVHVGGYGPLREALASYLRSSRTVVCQPEQVLIVSTARAGLDLIARLTADPGMAAFMEEPGYNTAKKVLRLAGLNVVPVPVDAEGLRIDLGEQAMPAARLAYVTPSHQWPTGVSLSQARRRRLLQWAERRDGWIVEDDYDSEFRFAERPLPTLQGLDGGKRVIYLGTFSKTMFPSLRTAYVVVPRAMAPSFRNAVHYLGKEPPLHVQAALAEFIQQGYFFSHIRHMRRVYKRRQAAFVDAMHTSLGGTMRVQRPAGGMQMLLSLPADYPATAVSRSAGRAGLHARPLSVYAQTDAVPNALHLGFAAVPDRLIGPAAGKLANAILSSR